MGRFPWNIILVQLSLFLPSHNKFASALVRPLTNIRDMSAAKSTKSIKSFFTVDSVTKKRKAEDEVHSDVPAKEVRTTVESEAEESSTSAAVHASAVDVEPILPPIDERDLELTGWPPMDNLEPSWRRRLQPEFRKPYFQRLLQFLATESQSHTIFPPSNQIFTALNLCPYDGVKVVVIGQDPYHGPGQAHGLAFSVQKGVQPPPSLRNMITEAQNDPALNIPKPTHGNLECWSRQGVLLLNAVLTVRKADANSHQKKGWEEFTDAIVRELGKKEGLVYLLWGKPAQAK